LPIDKIDDPTSRIEIERLEIERRISRVCTCRVSSYGDDLDDEEENDDENAVRDKTDLAMYQAIRYSSTDYSDTASTEARTHRPRVPFSSIGRPSPAVSTVSVGSSCPFPMRPTRRLFRAVARKHIFALTDAEGDEARVRSARRKQITIFRILFSSIR